MGVRSHDQGFVGSPPDRVYATLADTASYPSWWAGSRAEDGGVRLPFWSRTPATAERHRAGVGLYLVSPAGSLEWYLEPFEDGTIVNAFLEQPGRVGARRLVRARAAIRRGMVGLHRGLGSEH